MTNKEKQLLLQDLCARLLYGVIVQYKQKTFMSYGEYNVDTKIEIDEMLHHRLKLLDFKPYLRPMSSMTIEEKECYEYLCSTDEEYRQPFDSYHLIDWLNTHHFDYRGLIEKGLAVEAPKGMY